MTATPGTPPALSRPVVDLVVVDQWTVDSSERQRAVTGATIAAWERRPWPPGLVSLRWLLSNDGQVVLTYAHWASGEAGRDPERIPHPAPDAESGVAPAGVARPGPVLYELYRGTVPKYPSGVTGCVVIVDIEAGGLERARRWVDFMFDVVGAESGPPPGLISAHFHISLDGTRVLNYAEWADEESHEALVAAGRPSAVMSQIDEAVPGVRPVGFRRYTPHRHLIAPESASTTRSAPPR